MPKDPTKNIDRYKVKGGHLNEFDFTQHQEELSEKQTKRESKLIPGTPPEEKTEGLRPVVNKTQKSTKKSSSKPAARKTAKTAARKTAKKAARKTAKPAARKTAKKAARKSSKK